MYGPCLLRRLNNCVIILVLVWMLCPRSYKSDEHSRKTYIVRYANGEFTIPVTVVLDYKKQAEYVINMNPRSPTKSVTFYDFKQKSIAYKDMSNKECFIGKLSYETLDEENQHLKDVQNPVDTIPTVLNLDSSRSSLTPTEVRNIAGQKIAMFCRRMAAWLLQETHKRTRRQIGHRVERKYKHYGQEKHEYTRYGHETYEISYPKNSYSTRKRRRENQMHEGKENIFYPSVTDRRGNELLHQAVPVNVHGPLAHEDDIRISNGFGSKFDKPATIPLYKPSRNASLHNLLSYPLKNTVEATRPAAHPLRSSLVVISEHPRGPPSGLLEFHPNYNPQAANRTLPVIPLDHTGVIRGKKHFIPPPGSLLTNSRPVDVGKSRETAVNNYLSVPHFEYVHQLRRGPQSPPEQILLSPDIYQVTNSQAHVIPKQMETFRNSDNSGKKHAPLAELRNPNSPALHTFPPELPYSNKVPLSSYENVTAFGNPDHVRHETENGGLDFTVARQETETKNEFPNYTNKSSFFESINDLNFHVLSPYGLVRQLNNTDWVNNRSNSHKLASETVKLGSTNERSDIPEEHIVLFPVPSPDNKTQLLPQRMTSRKNHSIPSISIQEGVPPQKKRSQNLLELFTPDEIVIDIGKIPALDSDRGVHRFREPYSNATILKSRRNGTKFHPSKKHDTGLARRKAQSANNFTRQRADGAVVPIKRIYESPRPSQAPPPAVLPPGIAVYPRHPGAPYAQLASTSEKHTMTSFNTPIHNQRHHRKKLKKASGCCPQEHGQPSDCCQRNQCCNSRRRRGHTRSCCKTKKSSNRSDLVAVNTSRTTHAQNMTSESKDSAQDLCDVKRMCRTLYQSTKAVKVCKLSYVPGC